MQYAPGELRKMRPNSFGIWISISAALVLSFFVFGLAYNHYDPSVLKATHESIKNIINPACTPSTSAPVPPEPSPSACIPPPTPEYFEEEHERYKGVTHFNRVRTGNVNPSILVLLQTRDHESWGSNGDQPPRSFHDFLDLLASTGLELSSLSLGLLTASHDEYELYKNVTASLPFARTSIILHSGYDASVPDRNGRHDESLQVVRRREIARVRNYLMSTTLAWETHILWLDSDVYELSPNIVQTMIQYSTTNDTVGLLTARCERDWSPDYDLNSYAIIPGAVPQRESKHFPSPYERPPSRTAGDLVDGTTDDDLIRLDAIGGTILYIRADVVRQGLMFASNPVIGISWDEDGYDAHETEGLCVNARPMGQECFLLGGSWKVRHTDW